MKFWYIYNTLHWSKCIWKYHLRIGDHFVKEMKLLKHHLASYRISLNKFDRHFSANFKRNFAVILTWYLITGPLIVQMWYWKHRRWSILWGIYNPLPVFRLFSGDCPKLTICPRWLEGVDLVKKSDTVCSWRLFQRLQSVEERALWVLPIVICSKPGFCRTDN